MDDVRRRRRNPLHPVRARLLGADPIHGAPVRDGEHPRQAAPALRVEPGRGAPDLDEHLLGHLLRLRRRDDLVLESL